MDALIELWWVIILIGGPALIAVLWERRKKNDNYMAQWDAFYEAFDNDLDKQRQKHKDDHTFKTVEEYRNDSD